MAQLKSIDWTEGCSTFLVVLMSKVAAQQVLGALEHTWGNQDTAVKELREAIKSK